MSIKNKILYVDDEDLNLQLFEFNFMDTYDVITGNSGIEGLQCLEKYPDIKVVISDMKMPAMTGLEFITIAKEQFAEKTYFVLTGYDFTDELERAVESKLIHKYLRKPFNIDEIETAIKEVI